MSQLAVRISPLIVLVGICLPTRLLSAGDVPSFQRDVIPVLTRFDCNSGGCHGKLAGQNGFRLSLRGFDPDLDYESLTREARGRRINFAAPQQSLLVSKALGTVPHGGGPRFAATSQAAKLLTDWIAAGAPGLHLDEHRLQRIEVSPTVTTLSVGQSIPLTVTAWYDDGQTRDVTWLTQFASADSSQVEVTRGGIVEAKRNGETVVRAAFDGLVEIATFSMPFDGDIGPQDDAIGNNEIDKQVFAKLAKLRIEPSGLCDDGTFIRRASLDAIGTLPTADQVCEFLANSDTNKRAVLVDQLLEQPEFNDFWALQLGNLLQNRKERDHDVRGSKGVRAMHEWLRVQLAARRSWRDIAREIMTVTGPCDEFPAVGYYIVTVGEKEAPQSEVADSVAQAFMGTRIGCARCHNHPLEKYTQDDYYHFVAFFSRIVLDRKPPQEAPTELALGTRHLLNLQRELEQRQRELDQLRTSGNESQSVEQLEQQVAGLHEQISSEKRRPVFVAQPRTGDQLEPQPLDRSKVEFASGADPREALFRWMTEGSNEAFSGAMVNRLWKHFMGVGLVEPVDDLRATNPPSNRELWETLNREFVSSGYDFRHLIRLIMNSRTYQLAPDTRPANFRDNRFYSHFYPRRLPAEVLLDAICQATGEPEPFPGYPLGIRAIQVPDPGTESYFLSLFGRSERTTACACEQSDDVTLPQLLHLQNGDSLLDKLKSPTGKLVELIGQHDTAQVVEQLFLSTVSRLPSDEERRELAELLADSDREEVLFDVFWALLNSKEFAFQH